MDSTYSDDLRAHEEAFGQLMVEFAANPTLEQIEFIETHEKRVQELTAYTNYFYEGPYGVELLVPDTKQLRRSVKRNDMVLSYYGYNTDPVTVCSMYDILTASRSVVDVYGESITVWLK